MTRILTTLLTTLVTTASFAVAASFTAFAGTALAKKADTNKDGLISQAEFSALGDKKFSETDTDANGSLTPAERKAYRMHMRDVRAQARFAKTDANGDGQISNEEFTAARTLRKQKIKKHMDANGDGMLTDEDRQIRRKNRQERRVKRQEMRQKFKPDANGDGVVDLAEHRAVASAMFAQLDKDGDGMLSENEQRRPKKRHKKHNKKYSKKHNGMRR